MSIDENSWIQSISTDYLPTWTIHSECVYPTNLSVRSIVEMPEFGNLLMASCAYTTDSPALLAPDLYGTRIFVPWEGQQIGEEIEIQTSFRVISIQRKSTEYGSLYCYDLESSGDQLVISEMGTMFVKYEQERTDYQEYYLEMVPAQFLVISQGLEEFINQISI